MPQSRSWRLAEAMGEEYAVNAIMLMLLMVGMPVFAVGIGDLQAKLERWDYQRHADD
jgi:hypothetical protein